MAEAKRRYARARARIGVLNRRGDIVTDRSGYNAEVGLGGLTNSEQISISPGTMDNPSDNESVVTFIHESMHAGNSSVTDRGYITQPSFKELSAADKLINAAHFEVVPRRILGAAYAFLGEVFVPAGTTTGSHTAPALTPRQEAIRGATEEYRAAWTAGLTIHTRQSSIHPAGTPAQQPVTLIDIALSEGVVAKMGQGQDEVPETEVDATLFLATYATPAELAAATTVALERDLLVRLVIRRSLRRITGDEDRDALVVARLARANRARDFTDMLRTRTTTTFP